LISVFEDVVWEKTSRYLYVGSAGHLSLAGGIFEAA